MLKLKWLFAFVAAALLTIGCSAGDAVRSESESSVLEQAAVGTAPTGGMRRQEVIMRVEKGGSIDRAQGTGHLYERSDDYNAGLRRPGVFFVDRGTAVNGSTEGIWFNDPNFFGEIYVHWFSDQAFIDSLADAVDADNACASCVLTIKFGWDGQDRSDPRALMVPAVTWSSSTL